MKKLFVIFMAVAIVITAINTNAIVKKPYNEKEQTRQERKETYAAIKIKEMRWEIKKVIKKVNSMIQRIESANSIYTNEEIEKINSYFKKAKEKFIRIDEIMKEMINDLENHQVRKKYLKKQAEDIKELRKEAVDLMSEGIKLIEKK